MGLMFPEDFDAWQRWQHNRHMLRRLRDVARRPAPVELRLHVRGDEPAVLFALDATTPTALASVLEPLAHLGDAPVAVLAPADVASALPGEWKVTVADAAEAPCELGSVRAVVSAGHFLPAGNAAYRWSRRLDAQYLVVQHGLLTPHAPPLADGAHLLAFSDRDAEFWLSGRSNVTAEVIGSQLLWKAATAGTGSLSLSKGAAVEDASTSSATQGVGSASEGVSSATQVSAPRPEPIFLGQLHGAELSRRISAATAEAFCRQAGGLYRPHPAEVDKLSRIQHAVWRRRGIRFAEPGPLLAAGRPVVSIFSTGVLEAAAAGIPSWVTCVRPPAWVREFWDRYDLALWGGAPTPAPEHPKIEPARAVAERALAVVGGDL